MLGLPWPQTTRFELYTRPKVIIFTRVQILYVVLIGGLLALPLIMFYYPQLMNKDYVDTGGTNYPLLFLTALFIYFMLTFSVQFVTTFDMHSAHVTHETKLLWLTIRCVRYPLIEVKLRSIVKIIRGKGQYGGALSRVQDRLYLENVDGARFVLGEFPSYTEKEHFVKKLLHIVPISSDVWHS